MEAPTICAPLVSLAFGIFGLGIVVAVFQGIRADSRVLSVFLFAGCFLILAGAITGWPSGFIIGPLPIYLGGLVPITQQADSLSLFFLGILGFVAMAVALYSTAYFEHVRGGFHSGIYWGALFLFIASISQIFLCVDGISFIVFWEIMSLSSVVLVLTDHISRKARKAALIYLGATRVSTTLILIGFIWLHALSSSWKFTDWNLLGAAAVAPFVILCTGLCIKAGTWPFHLWLPYAHTEAPAPVSALMSGVMVKVAIYAMIRMLLMTETVSLGLAYFALVIGTISAFWGILFAQIETDLKRLLAYSTVENIGLIVLSIGLVLLGKYNGNTTVASIALAACLFHVLNHALYKPLLFLAAGAVDWSVHTRELSRLGGLQKYMPWTAAMFFIGCICICSLPPSNGFASKWLIYQGLFSFAISDSSIINCAVAMGITGLLSMIGALSVASFTKAFGLCFLGPERTEAVTKAREMPLSARVAQGVLLGAILPLSFFAMFVPSMLTPATRGILTTFDVPLTLPAPQLVVALMVLLALFYLVLTDFGRRPVSFFSTWECGFGSLPMRSSISALSFSRPIANLFRMVLQIRTHNKIEGADRRHFPDAIHVEGHQTILVWKLIYRPILTVFDAIGQALIRLQTGSIHVHLLYVFATLILLVLIGTQQ